MRDPLGLGHEWFRPRWRRALVLAVCLGWGAFELATGSGFFAVLFLAVGVYAARFWARRGDGGDQPP